MKNTTKLLLSAAAIPFFAATLLAQQTTQAVDSGTKTETAKPKSDSTAAKAHKISTLPAIEFQHLRPADQRGMNVFKTPKYDTVPYTGFKIGWAAAFTQQFQGLRHSNTAAARPD